MVKQLKKDYEKLNFTIGPVMAFPQTLRIMEQQVPYFRTDEFSTLMMENETMTRTLFGFSEDARVLFMTGSGTASMEAAVMNCLTQTDRAIVVNGGSFGERFVQICDIHNVGHTQIALDPGAALMADHLSKFEGDGSYTAFLVNLHETSTGVLYDMNLISEFCKRNHLFLIVDAISSFLADDLNAAQSNVDVVITGSQKALALAPGISVIGLSKRAQDRINQNKVASLYFDLKLYLKNGERGQPPFTPAVSVLVALNERLKTVLEKGLKQEQARIAALAEDFRQSIKELPFEILAQTPSNAVTALKTKEGTSATVVFEHLKNEYDIFVCPNGGSLQETVFRVGHIGCLTVADNKILVDALFDLLRRGIIK